MLVLDLVALAGMYLAGMFYTANISMDQYWWWWVIHLWVEATWEVLVGCIMAWGLMKTLGARREDRHDLAVYRSRVDVRLGDPRTRTPLFLDRNAGVLAERRRVFLGTGTDSTGRDGRSRGVRLGRA